MRSFYQGGVKLKRSHIHADCTIGVLRPPLEPHKPKSVDSGKTLHNDLMAPCPFCGIQEGDFLCANSTGIAFYDRFPINEGHALVIPRAHVASVFDLDPAVQNELWEMVVAVRKILADRFSPAGFNVGVNDGVAAGQTIDHAHIHIIPRYENDVADPRGGIRWVLPERARYWKG